MPSLRKRMSEKCKTPRKLPRWKKRLFSFVALILALVVIETFSFLAIEILMTSMKQLRSERDAIAATGIGREHSGTVVHPYLGWVHDPHTNSVEFDGRTIPINKLGFADDGPSIQKRGPGRVVIGIVGGSVAWQFSIAGEAAFRSALQRAPRFRGKKIVIVRIAIGAHKQPQQLFALNYLLSLGAEFDYLINIDGFNEVALVSTDNIPVGTFYAYPYGWAARSVGLMDPQNSAIAFQLLETRGSRQQWAQQVNGRSLYQLSPTVNLIWKLRDKQHFANIAHLQIAMRNKRSKLGRGYLQTGPKANPKTEAELFSELARFWKRCSILLNGICNANGIQYLNFLQPNQYVNDSKPMGPSEHQTATVGNPSAAEFAAAVTKGYPLLIQEGADLPNHGVRFHDLTMLFATTKSAIYVDSCCHYNESGYGMLAEAIAEAMDAH